MSAIIFTVTNDISYDQRMQRICSSLAAAGHQVSIIGVQRPDSIPLVPMDLYGASYQQKRLPCFFQTGPLFYLEFNLRLLVLLCSFSYDIACAIDLDTILPVWLATSWRGKQRVYDAHEYFTDMKEVRTRPAVQRVWKWIEKRTIPKFQKAYTVNHQLAERFWDAFHIKFEVIRNLPTLGISSNNLPNLQHIEADVLADTPGFGTKNNVYFSSNKLNQLLNNQLKCKFILYQGAVNHGRGFEQLIPAMQWVDAPLLIVGKGNFLTQTTALIKQYQLQEKVFLHPPLPPAELKQLTPLAHFGLTIFEAAGVNQYYSLANRFFDYMAAGIPQVCVNYPLYAELVQQYPIALLINDIESRTISQAMNNLLTDAVLYSRLRQECPKAAKGLNWENESIKLIAFYSSL